MIYLHIVERLIRSPLTQYQIPILQKFIACTLQTSAIMLHELYTNTCTSGGNKQMNIADKRSCFMLKLAAKFGIASYFLYIAVYINLQNIQTQRSSISYRDDKGQVSTARSDVQASCRPREVYWGCGGSVLVYQDETWYSSCYYTWNLYLLYQWINTRTTICSAE